MKPSRSSGGSVPPVRVSLPVRPVRVVVFAKAPLPGRAKTRLAPALGMVGAARLAQRLLHDALARVAAACQSSKAANFPQPPTDALSGWVDAPAPISAELCSAPGPHHADWAASLPNGPRPATGAAGGACWRWSDQGDGDLGQRMARASQRVTATGHAVLLVGTDCPSLRPPLLRQAAQQLQHHDAVLLPAADGGYVLLGLRQHQPALFEHMPWSTAQVAAITLGRLHALGLSVWQGPTLHDVDELADLVRLASLARVHSSFLWEDILSNNITSDMNHTTTNDMGNAPSTSSEPSHQSTHALVADYYGQQLQSSADLKTSACCDTSAMPEWLKSLLSRIHSEVLSRYYGCGLVCPPLLQGCRVLDLGCGAGRDVYALAQMVGPTGQVVGVDMTAEQLDVARRHQAHQAQVFGFDNVRFVQGHIERLGELGLEPGSFDVIVSNCVVNLSPDKPAVMAGVAQLLKPGGEFYFSDVYADRRVPTAVRNDPVLYGECLGGALYWKDFERLSHRAGFADPRLVESRPLLITDPDLARRAGPLRFFSATYRLFKLAQLETACEDYGQAVVYQGTIPEHPDRLVLDAHHDIPTGKVFAVCGNTWHMLRGTRLAPHFQFVGDFSRHFGIFEGCGTALPFAQSSADGGAAGGACC